jgi:hypothetical protein
MVRNRARNMKGVVADAIKETGRIVMMEAMDEKEKET